MSGRQGVTVIELAIMIAIIGILAWAAFPKTSPYYELKLDAAARRLASDLRYAQNRAIARRVIHGVLFEPALSRYTVFAPNAATPLTDPMNRGKTLRVDFTSSPEFKGVAITSATFGTTTGVTFDYFGVPRDTAGVDLASTGRVILSYQGLSDTVDVTPATGKVVTR